MWQEILIFLIKEHKVMQTFAAQSFRSHKIYKVVSKIFRFRFRLTRQVIKDYTLPGPQ